VKVQDFIAIVAPIAVKLRLEGSSIFPSVRIAQAYHETGGVIHPWNNLVGYKVGSGEPNAYWHGETVSTRTWEVVDGARYDNEPANWRAYDTIEDCFRDQDLLFERERYRRVREAETPLEQTAALYMCGYATDPQYPSKLYAHIVKYDLAQYDMEVQDVLEQLKKEIEQLKQEVDALKVNDKSAEIPEWAQEAVQSAVAAGVLEEPENGSYDFYRILTILHRKGLI
jgi:flagellar protein FlgJ